VRLGGRCLRRQIVQYISALNTIVLAERLPPVMVVGEQHVALSCGASTIIGQLRDLIGPRSAAALASPPTKRDRGARRSADKRSKLGGARPATADRHAETHRQGFLVMANITRWSVSTSLCA
jgi:hypothetical protein